MCCQAFYDLPLRIRTHIERKELAAALSRTNELWMATAEEVVEQLAPALDALAEGRILEDSLNQAVEMVSAGRELCEPALIELIERARAQQPAYQLPKLISLFAAEPARVSLLARALQAACSIGQYELVRSFEREHAELVRRETVLWGIVGRCHLMAADSESARVLLADWRTRPDATLDDATVFAVACFELGDVEAAAAAREALNRFPRGESTSTALVVLLTSRVHRAQWASLAADMVQFSPLLCELQPATRELFWLFAELHGARTVRAVLSIDRRFDRLLASHPQTVQFARGFWDRAVDARLPQVARMIRRYFR